MLFIHFSKNLGYSFLASYFETSLLTPNVFNILSLNIILLSFGIITFKNPLYSLVSLIGTLLNAVLILFLCDVEFLALTFLIIYVGAIAILFLFVIMMFNLKKLQSASRPLEWFTSALLYLQLMHGPYILITNSIEFFLEDAH
jgi:NADH:ubiquinone oxidoreductase subunit 6 (subunit J)